MQKSYSARCRRGRTVCPVSSFSAEQVHHQKFVFWLRSFLHSLRDQEGKFFRHKTLSFLFWEWKFIVKKERLNKNDFSPSPFAFSFRLRRKHWTVEIPAKRRPEFPKNNEMLPHEFRSMANCSFVWSPDSSRGIKAVIKSQAHSRAQHLLFLISTANREECRNIEKIPKNDRCIYTRFDVRKGRKYKKHSQ